MMESTLIHLLVGVLLVEFSVGGSMAVVTTFVDLAQLSLSMHSLTIIQYTPAWEKPSSHV
jgi:hypothetical protein